MERRSNRIIISTGIGINNGGNIKAEVHSHFGGEIDRNEIRRTIPGIAEELNDGALGAGIIVPYWTDVYVYGFPYLVETALVKGLALAGYREYQRTSGQTSEQSNIFMTTDTGWILDGKVIGKPDFLKPPPDELHSFAKRKLNLRFPEERQKLMNLDSRILENTLGNPLKDYGRIKFDDLMNYSLKAAKEGKEAVSSAGVAYVLAFDEERGDWPIQLIEVITNIGKYSPNVNPDTLVNILKEHPHIAGGIRTQLAIDAGVITPHEQIKYIIKRFPLMYVKETQMGNSLTAKEAIVTHGEFTYASENNQSIIAFSLGGPPDLIF